MYYANYEVKTSRWFITRYDFPGDLYVPLEIDEYGELAIHSNLNNESTDALLKNEFLVLYRLLESVRNKARFSKLLGRKMHSIDFCAALYELDK